MQVLRFKAGLLIQQIEDKVAGGRLIFGCNHPLYLVHVGFDSCSWMVAHRFLVSADQTAFERASDRKYSGKFAMFSEDILGYLAV